MDADGVNDLLSVRKGRGNVGVDWKVGTKSRWIFCSSFRWEKSLVVKAAFCKNYEHPLSFIVQMVV